MMIRRRRKRRGQRPRGKRTVKNTSLHFLSYCSAVIPREFSSINCEATNLSLISAVLQRKLEATQEELMRTQMRYQKEIEKLEKINKELKKQGHNSKPYHLLTTSINDWVEPRLVNGHRPGRLVDLDILADFKIMVDRVENHDRAIKMTHIEAKSIIIWLRYDTKWNISASCVVMLPNKAYNYILGHIIDK